MTAAHLRQKVHEGMGRLQDKIAIVTGAAAGIGYGIAKLFATEGAALVLTDIDEVQGRREDGWRAVVEGTLARFGRLDILVNNAGIQISRPLEDILLAEWRRVFQSRSNGGEPKNHPGTDHGREPHDAAGRSYWP
jgi:NAD(P)-dependent dehydrogenase (short-subunit alcohol dehydrogenase family)